jgi:phosphatidylglycerol:prolipoprotein diacylglycerol transferase
MYPVLFRIGDFSITTFGLMMVVSFIGGSWVTAKMLKRYGLPPGLIWDMLAWIAIVGIVGAKVYYLALHWEAVIANPRDQILSREGLVWYGGLIGGVLAYYLQVRARKLPLAVMFDATAPALFLAIASGRIGCFLVGDDYGLYTDGPFGVAFPQGIPPSTAGYLRSIGDSIPASISNATIVPVHPTQLYEVAIALVLFAVLWQLGKRRLKPGRLFASFMALYAVERFLIEFVRAKGDRFVFGLSTAQAVSIVLIIAASALWHRQRSKPDWSHHVARATPATKPKPSSVDTRFGPLG